MCVGTAPLFVGLLWVMFEMNNTYENADSRICSAWMLGYIVL